MPDPKKPKIDENYRCPISLKKISKISDPVLTPAGHIYERAALIAVINSTGNDPMVGTPLTLGMIIEGFAVKEIVNKFKKDITKLEDKLKANEVLLDAVLEQNKLLKKQVVLATWGEHGRGIDKKLDKGSSIFADEKRTAELKKYKEKVLKSEDDQQLKKAVQDTATLKSADFAKRRYFNFKWLGNSETTKVVSEFQDKVTASKGWF